ncbi:MAG: C_GCAxxG_C_C family protein [Peptococcaceae bacterium]|nr:C_GCAxxG_C_C family protein [Ruminococcus sp.]MBQ7025734.1 C_GCAxxG_C_C family protein [Peptococcaceae bacterium]
MGRKADLAKDLFLQGYNCAQAVFGAFCEDFGIERSTGFVLSSGFGGGISRRREVCGAVSGAVMVLSLKYGYSDAKADDAKKALYAKVRGVLENIEAETGSIICRELLGLDEKVSTPVPEKRTAKYYAKRPCAELVYICAKAVEEHLENIAD